MRSKRLIAPALLLAALGSVSGRAASAAKVDWSRYVALGDSLTAGFADGGLYRSAQQGAYPVRLARLAGLRATLEQPWMTEPGIPAALRFKADSRASLVPRAGLGSPVNLTLPRPYDNLAVPGAKVGDALRASSDAGGLGDLVLRGLGTQLEQALLLEPTFVSVWLGNSDVLGAAVSGIVLDGATLTPLDRFSRDVHEVLQSLAAGGTAAGVIATIPRITDLPYVSALDTRALDEHGLPLQAEGSALPLLGPDGPLEAGDFVLLSASPRLARGDGVARARGGSGVALPDEVVLSRLEARQVNDRIRQYNEVIRQAAADVGFAVVETAELYREWSRDGVRLGRERFGTGYPDGGLFSLDGLHPSALGQALLANAFAEAINAAYGASIRALSSEALLAIGNASRAAGRAAEPPGSVGVGHRLVFSGRASRNLRFGLAVPRPARLLRLKHRALERRRELERRRRPVYELPAEPVLAVLGVPPIGPRATAG